MKDKWPCKANLGVIHSREQAKYCEYCNPPEAKDVELRAYQLENSELCAKLSRLHECSLCELLAENPTALANHAEWEQRAEAAEHSLAAARERLLQHEEDEASVCPEDVGFVEYIGVLEKRLAAAREQVEQLRKALEKHQQKLSSVSGQWSRWPHIPPPAEFIEKNKLAEPEGERLRAELTDWLKRNQIVGGCLDTENHTVSFDIGRLPDNLKWVLRGWGSITVADDDDAAALATTEPRESLNDSIDGEPKP